MAEFLTRAQRIAIQEAHSAPGCVGAYALERYEDTVCKLEVERNLYKAVADTYMGEWPTPREKAADIRYWTKVLDMEDPVEEIAQAEAWEALADHLESLEQTAQGR